MHFQNGQAVRWPPAPRELAQVVEIRRTCVRLYYRTKKHELERQPIVPAAELEALQRHPHGDLPLPLFNLFNRAIIRRRSKT